MNEINSLSYKNREQVENSTMCGCYFCLETYPSTEVVDFVDKGDQTALCPRCRVDSVLPDITDIAFLKNAHDLLFFWKG